MAETFSHGFYSESPICLAPREVWAVFINLVFKTQGLSSLLLHYLFIGTRFLVAFFPVVFLIHGSCLIAIYFQDVFPSAQFIIRVFFLFAEFISGCAKTGSGAGPDDWQHAMGLASKNQAGISHSTTDISCHGTGPLASSPRSWQESCCNQSKPVALGQPHSNSIPNGPKCHSGVHLYYQAEL